MKYACIAVACLYFSISGAFSTLSAKETAGFYTSPGEVLSNQTILLSTLSDSLFSRQFFRNWSGPLAVRVVASNNEVFALVQHELQSRGLQISTDYSTAPILNIEVFASNSLIRQSRHQYKRTIRANVSVTITGTDGIVVRSDFFAVHHSDKFQISDPGLLESQWNASKFHEMGRDGWIGRIKTYAQPILITASIGTSIYLLYNIRSR